MATPEQGEKASNDTVFIPIPRFLRPLNRRIIERAGANRREAVIASEHVAQSVVGNLLATMVEVFPDQVDPLITETNVNSMTNDQLLKLRDAAHFVAPGYLLEEPVIKFVIARQADAAYRSAPDH